MRTVKWTKTNKKLILAASNEAKTSYSNHSVCPYAQIVFTPLLGATVSASEAILLQ